MNLKRLDPGASPGAAFGDQLRRSRNEKGWTQGARETATQVVIWNEGIAGLEQGVRLGIASGIFIDEPPGVLARTLIAILQAHLSCWLESGGHESHTEVAARLNRQVVHAICRPEILAERLARLAQFREPTTSTEPP